MGKRIATAKLGQVWDRNGAPHFNQEDQGARRWVSRLACERVDPKDAGRPRTGASQVYSENPDLTANRHEQSLSHHRNPPIASGADCGHEALRPVFERAFFPARDLRPP